MRGLPFPGNSSLCVLGLLLLGACSGNSIWGQRGPAPRVAVSGSDLESPLSPRLISWADAELSEEGRRAHYRGVCLVSLVVNDDGRPVNVHVVRPIGMGLDVNAVKAASRFRFMPAMEEDKPVPVKVTVEVAFQPDPSEGFVRSTVH